MRGAGPALAAVAALALVAAAAGPAGGAGGPSLSGTLPVPESAVRVRPFKDPFRPPPEPASVAAAAAAPRPQLAPLQLTAVLQGAGRSTAVVNGVILRPGDSYLGMEVLSIHRRKVIFRRGGDLVEVMMRDELYNGEAPE